MSMLYFNLIIAVFKGFADHVHFWSYRFGEWNKLFENVTLPRKSY